MFQHHGIQFGCLGFSDDHAADLTQRAGMVRSPACSQFFMKYLEILSSLASGVGIRPSSTFVLPF
jgi:hypothetical protein